MYRGELPKLGTWTAPRFKGRRGLGLLPDLGGRDLSQKRGWCF